MSTENNFVELFTKTRSIFSLFFPMAISGVIYLSWHMPHIILFGGCIQHPYSHYHADLCIAHNIQVVVADGASRRSELRNPANRIYFFAWGWNKCHDQNVYKWVKSLRTSRVYQVFSCANALIIKLFLLKLFFAVFWFHFCILNICFWRFYSIGKIIPLYLNTCVE